MSEREEQIQRLADAMKSGWDATRAHLDLATVMYLAGARIPDPPAPKTPEVVVSEEAVHAAEYSWVRTTRTTEDRLRAAFHHLLASNREWIVPSLGMCRNIVEEIKAPHLRGGRTEAEYLRYVLLERLAALGVTP